MAPAQSTQLKTVTADTQQKTVFAQFLQQKATVGRLAPRSVKVPHFGLTTTFPFARPASTQARASLVDENGNIRSITGRMSQRTQFGRRGRRTVLVATGCHGAADAFAFGFRQGVEGF